MFIACAIEFDSSQTDIEIIQFTKPEFRTEDTFDIFCNSIIDSVADYQSNKIVSSKLPINRTTIKNATGYDTPAYIKMVQNEDAKDNSSKYTAYLIQENTIGKKVLLGTYLCDGNQSALFHALTKFPEEFSDCFTKSDMVVMLTDTVEKIKTSPILVYAGCSDAANVFYNGINVYEGSAEWEFVKDIVNEENLFYYRFYLEEEDIADDSIMPWTSCVVDKQKGNTEQVFGKYSSEFTSDCVARAIEDFNGSIRFRKPT